MKLLDIIKAALPKSMRFDKVSNSGLPIYWVATVPDEVLENQAFWMLWNQLATVPPRLDLDRWELHIDHYTRNIVTSFNEGFEYEAGQTGVFELHQRNGFEREEQALEAIPLLGGQENIILQMSSGDLYSKWWLEKYLKG